MALITGPYFIKLVYLPVPSILSTSPDFIYLSPGLDFIHRVQVRILSSFESGPDCIKHVRVLVRVRVRTLPSPVFYEEYISLHPVTSV